MNATIWQSSFMTDVITDILQSQSSLRRHITSSLRTIGVTNSSILSHLARRNASETHELRTISFGENGVSDSVMPLSSNLNRSWQEIVDDYLDLFDMFIKGS